MPNPRIPRTIITIITGCASVLLGGCVANVHEIALDKALIQVVDGMNAMRQHQQELAKNESVSGDVGTSTGVTGGYGPATGQLTVTTDYKSGRSNQIVIKLGSLLDNQAITDGKISIDKLGMISYGKPGKGGTSEHPFPIAIQAEAVKKALIKAGIPPEKAENALKAIKPEIEKPAPSPQ
jgi:hypothetical protein